MITEDYWRCCKIIVNQGASVISKDGLQSSLKMNPIWVQGWTFSFPPPLPLPLYNIAEMDTTPHEFLCKTFSCKPRLCGQALLVKRRASLLCSMAGSLNRKSSYQLANWESKSMMAANPNGFWMPLGSDSHRLREKWFHICWENCSLHKLSA